MFSNLKKLYDYEMYANVIPIVSICNCILLFYFPCRYKRFSPQ